MVDLTVADGLLKLRVRGAHKLWAMKDSIEIPLQAIESVQADPEGARAGPEGTRNPGTRIPGVITAGSFNAGVKRVFWDVHNPENAIRIKLRTTGYLIAEVLDHYDEMVVEVSNPTDTVDQIRSSLMRS